ncbi:head processing protein [Pantoea sp. LMR881]|uniref:head processing protein n=1 Tax=Pantoea sp. LMR881 TaxID=3014336 RepID=UPI0022AF9310|nr:head processing protein [Pantoea sp. LMR881]MCZ4061222.1 head processing protein [Pantoea sp. LMR881]MCZ4061338.1 head processing protein [Pantoea sp. LMR881]
MGKEKTLRTVTDSFSLVDNIRKHTAQNGRKYIVAAVRATLALPEVKERIALGEMFGYYGHTNRALYHRETGSLDLPESCTVTIDGQKVVLQNVPSNRTLAISIDDNGIVEHTQEILDTEPGRIVDAMDRSMAGGWSWATKGSDHPTQSYVKGFSGVDYVHTPNYPSLSRSHAMLESVTNVDQWRVESLINAGYSAEAAMALLSHMDIMKREDAMYETAHRVAGYESEMLMMQGQLLDLQELCRNQVAMLESANAMQERREKMMDMASRVLPVFMSEKQKNALLNLGTPEHLEEVAAMFESINGGGLSSLPLGNNNVPHVPAPAPSRHVTLGTPPIITPHGMSLL